MIAGLKQRLTCSRHHTFFGKLQVPVPYVPVMDIKVLCLTSIILVFIEFIEELLKLR